MDGKWGIRGNLPFHGVGLFRCVFSVLVKIPRARWLPQFPRWMDCPFRRSCLFYLALASRLVSYVSIY